MSKKSQTATEYLVILAIIIVIALIVVSILGGSIGFGSGISENQARLALQTQSGVGVTDYSITGELITLQLTNNEARIIQIESIVINGKEMFNYTYSITCWRKQKNKCNLFTYY